MHYILSTKILQETSRIVLQKGVQESVIKILEKYTNKEVLKIPFWNLNFSPILFKDL